MTQRVREALGLESVGAKEVYVQIRIFVQTVEMTGVKSHLRTESLFMLCSLLLHYHVSHYHANQLLTPRRDTDILQTLTWLTFPRLETNSDT